MSQIAVPWYVYPVGREHEWWRVRQAGLAFAVVNVDNGPGTEVRSAFAPVLTAGSATPLVGYIDVGYGRRPSDDVRRDAARWADFYGITDVFLDQVPCEPTGHWTLEAIDDLRAAGADVVVTNPGTVPRPELIDASDVTCTFEGTWSAHQTAAPPAWVRNHHPDKQWHLVHSVPPSMPLDVSGRAAEMGARLSYATRATLPNPWDATWPDA